MGSGARDAASAAASADPAAVAASRRAAGVKVCFSSDLHGTWTISRKFWRRLWRQTATLSSSARPLGNGHGYHGSASCATTSPASNGKPDWACEALAYMQEGFQNEVVRDGVHPRLAARGAQRVRGKAIGPPHAPVSRRCRADRIRSVRRGRGGLLHPEKASVVGGRRRRRRRRRGAPWRVRSFPSARTKKDWERCDTRTWRCLAGPVHGPRGVRFGRTAPGVRVAIPLTDAHAEAHSIGASPSVDSPRARRRRASLVHPPPRHRGGPPTEGARREHRGPRGDKAARAEGDAARASTSPCGTMGGGSRRRWSGKGRRRWCPPGDFARAPVAVVMDTADPDGATRVECTGG